jgi:hypothetical protein
MSDVRVHVLRPLMYEGQRRERDAVLKVPPTAAWQLWASGRAELVDPERDGAVVRAAVEADTKKQLQRHEHEPGSPWQRIMRF